MSQGAEGVAAAVSVEGVSGVQNITANEEGAETQGSDGGAAAWTGTSEENREASMIDI